MSHEQDHAAHDGAASRSIPRRIVVGYRPGSLPGEWLQVWRRLDRVVAHSRMRLRASMEPLDSLPDDTDVLIVEPQLGELAVTTMRPDAVLICVSAPEAGEAIDALMAQLERAATDADLLPEPRADDAPRIVTYRGSTRLD